MELEQSCYMPLVPDGEAVLGALPDVEGVINTDELWNITHPCCMR